MLDISGHKFGRLTALKPNGTDSKGGYKWLCKCECGGTTVVRGGHLRKGEVKTCGGKGRSCKRREVADITGKTFGSLTIIRRNGTVNYGSGKVQKWECSCICGKILTVHRSRLYAGQNSCGCLSRERSRIRSIKHGMCGTPEYRLFHGARRRAKLGGYISDLTLSDIVIPKKCPLLGIPLATSKRVIGPGSPTVDRINPLGGYMKGNVWVVSQRANKLKSNMTLAEMKTFVIAIEAFLSSNASWLHPPHKQGGNFLKQPR